jgi:hypothetical protein
MGSTRPKPYKELAGSGLIAKQTANGTVTLEQQEGLMKVADAGQTTESAASDSTLPKVAVDADAENTYDDPGWQTDPYNTDYALHL